MLDKILANNSEIIDQSQSLDRIKGLGVSNPYEADKSKFFIDETNISSTALEKYQKELLENNFVDYDDLLMYALRILKTNSRTGALLVWSSLKESLTKIP